MAVQAGGRQRWLSRTRDARWGYGLASIWLVGFIVFAAFPLAMSVFISFTNWAPIGGPFWKAQLVGLNNYHTFLTDPVYWHSITNTIYYAVGSVLIVNITALPMALLLNQKLRGLNIYRTIFYLPAVMPTVATVMVFRLIFFPSTGLMSWILTKVHIQCDPSQITCNPINWLNDPHLTMPAVILISAWGVGQTLLIYLAGLQGIDQSYYEAASIDGAEGWTSFINITLPLLTPAIFFNIVTGLIGAFQEFSKFVIFSGGTGGGNTGGPDNSLLVTFLYVYIMGFEYQKMGLATAMAFGLFALIMIFTVVNFVAQRRWVFYQEER